MTVIELRALELKRRAWEALDRKTGTEVLFQELSKLERQTPELFEQVVKQLEADNGRWSSSSQLPNVHVKRDSAARIEEIAFLALDEEHLKIEGAEREASSLVWRSDHGEQGWIENFAKDYADNDDMG